MKKNYILILIFEIGFGLTYNIIGVISISELFLFLFGFYLLFDSKILFRRYPVLKKISWLYLGLLVSQIISEILVENVLNNALKGIAVTVVSYLHFMFLFKYFAKDRKLILFALVGLTIRQLVFGSGMDVETASAEEVLAGEGAVFLKFYLAGIIVPLLLIISALFLKKRGIIYIIIVASGLVFVVLGARSAGLVLVITGIISYFVLKGEKINRKQLITTLVITAILGYGLYVVYVNQVLEGKITAGNNEQIASLKNPYNPVNLIIFGRTGFFVGWQAFMDSPLIGNGAWSIDVSGKYMSMYAYFKGDSSGVLADKNRMIPSHSVLVGAGMNNGVFAFVFMFSILFFFIKTGFKALDKKDPYVAAVVYSILFILWNGLFSPLPHFKNTLPLYFVIILASYIANQRTKILKDNKQIETKK
ncbi:MAG: hypothetical protein FWD66_01895 [Paludibacter sp.]|nr:hypothetical protein [Paludibacter sp.]